MIDTVAQYRLVERLAQGGMGVVYRAEDERLGRQVAVKTLSVDLARDPLAVERFRREARTIAALNHPHICTLHDMVEHRQQLYLVMELLEGDTLRERIAGGPIPLRQVLAWSEQIADALGAAHALGIIHRDLKPANVMITARGDLKILDFGVAKLLEDGPADMQTMLTSAGMAVGTVAYMAPEQVRGEAVDARSDLFALGAVLYEMATRRCPFAGATVGVMAEAVLNRTPAPVRSVNPELPPGFEQIVARLLEKNPGRRYRSASEVAADLARLRETGTGPAPTPRRGTAPATASVAVLPFRNMSADPENAFFSDGIAEDLIAALGRIEGLRVVSRASSFRFRDQSTDPSSIGAALGVGALVEGSVRKSGDRLRIAAQLINASDGYQTWAERYDRTVADIFDIQDEIVAALVRAIAPALLGRTGNAVHRATENAEAYELYLKGRHYWHQRTPAVLKLAVGCFEQAIAVDPEFALAYAGIADCWSIYRAYGWLPQTVCQPPAKAAIDRALALEPDLPGVRFAHATYTLYFERDWRASEADFRRAVAGNPQSSLAHVYLAIVLVTAYGLEAGRPHIHRASELDPLSPFVHGLASLAYSVGRDYRAAEQSALRALDLQPDYALGLFALGTAREVGSLEGSVPPAERLVAVSRTATFLSTLARAYVRDGRVAEASLIEQELEERALRGEYIPAIGRLAIALARADGGAALRGAIRACYDDRTAWFTVALTLGPALDMLLDDAEIGPLVRAMRDGREVPGG
jgi:serine/threonine protein kinase/tetratricopeptide (TPR) repeat protein